MAETAIDIPEFVTLVEPVPDLPVHELTQAAADLLSSTTDLPAPRFVAVSAGGQEIELQFSGDPSTFHTMAAWAQRFGGTVTAEPGTDDDGTPYVRCVVRFTTGTIRVKAYAYIQAAKAT